MKIEVGGYYQCHTSGVVCKVLFRHPSKPSWASRIYDSEGKFRAECAVTDKFYSACRRVKPKVKK